MTVSRRATVVGFASLTTAGHARGQALRDISVGLASTSFATVAPRIAKDMGMFAAHGLNCRFVVLDSANAATMAIIAQSLDGAVSGPPELIIAQSHDQKVVALAYAYRGSSGTLVLSKSTLEKLALSTNASIAERLKALDGLVIASPSATGAYTVSFKAAAKSVGATIRFTYMAQPAMVAALESGAIQGYIGGAPFWAIPVIKGQAVKWISGPSGDLPAEFSPTSTSNFQVMRAFAKTNPDVVKAIKATFADLTKAIDERPAEVKAAVGRLYPDLDRATLDLLFATESAAWKSVPSTTADLAHEIAFVKAGVGQVPGLDAVDPAELFYGD